MTDTLTSCRSLEELARTLREEETLSYLQDGPASPATSTSVVTRAIPSAPPGPPPPDILSSSDLSSEEAEPGSGETAPDTRQLVRLLQSNTTTPALLCHKEPAQGTQAPILFLAFRRLFMA